MRLKPDKQHTYTSPLKQTHDQKPSIDSFPEARVIFIMYKALVGLARVTDRASHYPYRVRHSSEGGLYHKYGDK